MNPEQIPTPRTDAVAAGPDESTSRASYGLRMHRLAETLERELASAKEERDAYKQALEFIRDNGGHTCAEQARAALDSADKLKGERK